MSEPPPLSRFAGQHPKPRPTDTIIIPSLELTRAAIDTLLVGREIFTVEPSPTQPDVWHLGVFDSGRDIVVAALQRMGY